MILYDVHGEVVWYVSRPNVVRTAYRERVRRMARRIARKHGVPLLDDRRAARVALDAYDPIAWRTKEPCRWCRIAPGRNFRNARHTVDCIPF